MRIFWSRTQAQTWRFAVSPEESDEEKAIRKREKVVENLARCNRKRSKKAQRTKKRQKNSKKVAEEGTAHIDEVLEYQSETDRSRMK